MRLRYSGVVLGLLLACSVAGAWAPPSPAPAENAPARRLLYIGLALYSEAWSENDVVELADELSDVTGYRLVPMIASNVAARSPMAPPSPLWCARPRSRRGRMIWYSST